MQPGKRSPIRFLCCRAHVRRYFRCIKDLPDNRIHRHEEEFCWSYGDHPGHLSTGSIRQCGLSVLRKGQPEDQSPLLRQNRVCPDAEKAGWDRTFPVAEKCFRSKAPFPAGIPLAHGRPFHRPAKGDQGRRTQERFLTFVQNREFINFHSWPGSKEPMTYPPWSFLLLDACG